MIFQKKLGLYSVSHLLGIVCIVLCLYYELLFPLFWSLTFGMLAGLLWEILNEINYIHNWKFFLLDPRGTDIGDIITDVVGVVIALMIISYM